MKKVLTAAAFAWLVLMTGASTALATTGSTSPRTSEAPLTGAPAYQRCIAAGGTAHFCGDLGGYWYFV